VVLLSSRPGLDPAAAPCSPCAGFTCAQHPFFRRYGVNLPSSLTRDHSSALVSSTCLPVSVCGTGTAGLPSRHFLAAQVPRSWVGVPAAPPLHLSVIDPGTWSPRLPTGLDGAHLAAASPPQRPASVKRPDGGIGLSTDCPSLAPRGCSLGPTHPPRSTRAAEPLGFRRWGFAPHFSVTHSGIRTRGRSTPASADASLQPRRSPTSACALLRFGVNLMPRYSFGAALLDQ
jgi:hypothetical protein